MSPFPNPSASRVARLILAGGEGARLGGAIKADLTIGGVRLIERVAAALTGAGPLLVSVGRHDADEMGLPPGAVALADPDGIRGPLAGLAAAVEWCRSVDAAPEVIVTAAVDTPFLPSDFVAGMTEALGEFDGAIAAYGDQAYPTNAAWRARALMPLLDEEPEGLSQLGIKGLARRLRTRQVDWPHLPGGDPFANLNTPEDREILERRLAAGPGVSGVRYGVGKGSQTR